jgi:hypothetical protein
MRDLAILVVTIHHLRVAAAQSAELNDWFQAEKDIDSESAGGARQAQPEDHFTG